jgi:hypothetical protein
MINYLIIIMKIKTITIIAKSLLKSYFFIFYSVLIYVFIFSKNILFLSLKIYCHSLNSELREFSI